MGPGKSPAIHFPKSGPSDKRRGYTAMPGFELKLQEARLVIETARRLTPLGADVRKAEFPLEVKDEDEANWIAACAELNATSAIPWILLSAAVDFDTYLRQVVIACQAGASGIAVGRAVWKEAVGLQGETRSAFLRDIARPRLERLTALCQALARPWHDFFTPQPVDSHWYHSYPQS